jgi:hypothetical protein
MDHNLQEYNTEEWFESLAWQDMWIGYMVGWWVGHFGLPPTVMDFGCGRGTWSKCFRDLGSTVGGIELFEIAKDYIPDSVHKIVHDLRQPLDCGRGYDLTICLEVAEHMTEQHAGVLCHTLSVHTTQNLLFSAAQPGQEGTGHINLKPLTYWQRQLARMGLEFSPIKTAQVQEGFGNIVNSLYEYLPKNVLVFSRTR